MVDVDAAAVRRAERAERRRAEIAELGESVALGRQLVDVLASMPSEAYGIGPGGTLRGRLFDPTAYVALNRRPAESGELRHARRQLAADTHRLRQLVAAEAAYVASLDEAAA